jgi:lipoprotein-releasing system ATP-binding protein
MKNDINSGLCAVDISKSFSDAIHKRTLFSNINYVFSQSVSYALCGDSGAGKSTFLHILAGIQSPDTGMIFFDGKPISEISDFHTRTIGLVFQQPYLIDELSVIENVMIKGFINDTDSYERARDLLSWVGLLDYQHDVPRILSGGQRQRVALARALYSKPLFLLADEPTAGIDPAAAADIINLIMKCKQEWGMGIIISSHDIHIAQKMDRCLQLTNGKLKELSSC